MARAKREPTVAKTRSLDSGSRQHLISAHKRISNSSTNIYDVKTLILTYFMDIKVRARYYYGAV